MRKLRIHDYPVWKKFSRPFWVVSLSEAEHRLRDCRALMQLREFFLAEGFSQVNYATVTLIRGRPQHWPPVPAKAGLVVLGRPSLFGETVNTFLNQAEPAFGYDFLSNTPRPPARYRTIRCVWNNKEIPCALFAELRKSKVGLLTDNAMIYSGWQQGRPLMVLSGTSAVGTWGAAHYVTDAPQDSSDVRWNESFQGVIASSVTKTKLAFDHISCVKPIQILAPFAISFHGSSLPWLSGWNNLRLTGQTRDNFDIEIKVNGSVLAARAPTHLPLLTLLVWLSRNHAKLRSCGYMCDWKRADLVGSIFRFLWDDVGGAARQALETLDVKSPSAFKATFKTAIYANLDSLTAQIRKAGGIAFESPVKDDADEKDQGKRYTAFLRSLPANIPTLESRHP